ncbi:MAG: MarR family winged helix-turn-helix transcriptional regulator [Micromonosporaceae bacterium]
MRAAEELRYLLLAGQRGGHRLLGRELRPLGLTPSQAEVLRILEDYGPLTLSGLGELLVCESGTNPSRLVGRLVSQGAVERQPGGRDRREVELRLTAEGRRLARCIAKIEDRMYRAIDALVAGKDVECILDFLRGFVAQFPAGQALAQRARYGGQGSRI